MRFRCRPSKAGTLGLPSHQASGFPSFLPCFHKASILKSTSWLQDGCFQVPGGKKKREEAIKSLRFVYISLAIKRKGRMIINKAR